MSEPYSDGPLPEAPCSYWKPKTILHRLLMMDVPASVTPKAGARSLRKAAAGPVTFNALPVKVPTEYGPNDIERYAQHVADNPNQINLVSTRVDKTPWDVPVDRQCWLLFQLDPRISNWQFYSFGIVPKKRTGYDFGARHVLAGDTKVRSGTIDKNGCQVIYLAIGEREGYASQRYNLLVEFVHKAGCRLPVIFDPDIPNLGGSRIP